MHYEQGTKRAFPEGGWKLRYRPAISSNSRKQKRHTLIETKLGSGELCRLCVSLIDFLSPNWPSGSGISPASRVAKIE